MADLIRQALEPPAPAEPDTDAVLALAAIIRQVDGSHSLGAAVLAEAILSHPKVASVFQPPAPAPAADVCLLSNMTASQLARAAALLRQPAPAPDPREALAARPLLEAVVRLGDCIGQHTVGEITTISDRAAAWLRENPPGQPVAIEPRGCPTPGACSCVEPPAPAPAADGEREELIDWLDSTGELAGGASIEEAKRYWRAAALLRQPAPAPVPVAERPWKRPGWCDAQGRCWWFAPTEAISGGFRCAGWSLYAADPADEDTHCLPHWAIAIPQPPQGGEVEA